MSYKAWLTAVAVAVAVIVLAQVQAETTTKADTSKTTASPTMEAQPTPAATAEAATPVATPEAGSTLEVKAIAIAPEIKDREPVDAGNEFPATVGKLYCYTKIVGGKEGTSIIHRWKRKGEVVAYVRLAVNGSPWRTFSSKSIQSDWTGPWSVDVLEGDNVIKTIDFTIK